VKSKYENKFKAGAMPHLERGEEVLSAFIAQPRGRSQTVAGGGAVVAEIGARKQRKARAAADDAGLVLDAPMVLAVTNRRLLTLKISAPILGRGGEVKELLSAVPLADVDGVEVKRFGLGKRITVTVRGVAVPLEGSVGANEFLEVFEHARGAALAA
jgi:hypothetical protein